MPVYDMFHGTSSAFLDSIKTNGLIPNSKNKIWSDFSKATYETPGCKSLLGTYFTNNIMTAYTAAKTAIDKYPGKVLLISANIDSSTVLADEDNIWCWVETWIEKTFDKAGFKENEADKFLGFLESQAQNYITHIIKWFSEKLHKELTEQSNISIDYSLLTEVFYCSLLRRCSHLYNNDKIKFSINYRSHHKLFKYPSKILTIEQSEEDYIKSIEKMTIVYKESCVKDTNLHTLRVPCEIKFCGKNYILGMVVVNNCKIDYSWGNVSLINDKLLHHKNLALCCI